MFWQASAGTGVPVVAVIAVLVRSAQAFASDVVEVLKRLASCNITFAWCFNALAGTFFRVPDREVGFTSAVLGCEAASAADTVPVEAFTADEVASGRRANAVADFFIPVVARSAEMRMAEAAASVWVIDVSSPVLR